MYSVIIKFCLKDECNSAIVIEMYLVMINLNEKIYANSPILHKCI